MSNVVDFPAAEREVSAREVNDRHTEAFRDLEGKISNCTIMAIIAVQMAEPFINTRDDEAERALFAVWIDTRTMISLSSTNAIMPPPGRGGR